MRSAQVSGQQERLIGKGRCQPIIVTQLAADSLLLFMQPDCLVWLASCLENNGLAAEASLQSILISQFSADSLLLFIQPHRLVWLASRLENNGLAAEVSLQSILVAQVAGY